MQTSFDPYYKWLGIPPQEQPPNHYRLLGLGLFESDLDVIETAADRQMLHVQTFKTGQHSAISQKVLNELTQARLCLLNAGKKAAYDRQLKAALDAQRPPGPPAAPLPRAIPLQPAAGEAPSPLPIFSLDSTGVGPIHAIQRTPKKKSPWLLVSGGLTAMCIVAAVAVLVWRSQPIQPELAPLANQVLDEGQPLELDLPLKNPQAASQGLEYYLVQGAPPGSRVDRQTGKFLWTPGESQGPGQYQATVRVALAKSPHVFHEQTVKLTVNEVAQPPQLEPIEPKSLVSRGGMLSLRVRARDLDVPAGKLQYAVQIEPAVSSAASIDRDTGVFTWQPSAEDFGKSFRLAFQVAKASDESLRAEQTIGFTLQTRPATAQTPGNTPTPPTSPSAPMPGGALDQFVEAMRTRWGAEVVLTDEASPWNFGGKQRILRVNQHPVTTVEYADAEAAEADRLRIASDGGTVLGNVVKWPSTPHFFVKQNLLVLYVGQDPNSLTPVQRAMGNPRIRGTANIDPSLSSPVIVPSAAATATNTPTGASPTMPTGNPPTGTALTDTTLTPTPPAPKKKKSAIPDEDAQKAAAEVIERLFADQLKSRKPDERQAAGKELLQQAPGTTDLASRYVLLTKARDLAVLANDVDLAWRAIEALNEDFEIDDFFEQKVDALKKGSGGTRTTAESHDLADRYLALIEQAQREEKFDQAQPLVQPATAAAIRSKDLPLVNKIKDLGKQLRDQKKEFDAIQTARATLKESPDDAAANLALGRYLCLSRQQWSQGLPHLLKGDSPTWIEAAKLDTANPTAAADRVTAGDAWWALAEAAKAGDKEPLQKRAVYWYQQALPELTGLDKTKIERKFDKLPEGLLASISNGTPGASRVPSTTPAPSGPGDPSMDRAAAEAMRKAARVEFTMAVEGQRQQVRISSDDALPQANFRVLHVSLQSYPFDDAVLSHVKNFRFLDRIWMGNSSLITDAGMETLAACPTLRSIGLHGTSVTDAGIAQLRGLQRLEDFQIGFGKVTGSGFAQWKGMPLKTINISSELLTDEIFKALGGMPTLTNIDLSCNGGNVTGAGMSELSKLPLLRYLTLDCTGIEQSQFAELRKIPGLQRCTISNGLKEAGLLELAKLNCELRLDFTRLHLGDEGLNNLGRLTRLTELNLQGPGVTDNDLVNAGRAPSLRSLRVDDASGITDAGLATIASARQLQSMTLNQAGQLTNAGFAQFGKLPALSNLHIGQAPKLTDAGLAALRNSAALRYVYLFGCTGITDSGVQALSMALPQCTVRKQ